MTKRENPRPFRPVSPGEVLQAELEARRWTAKRLAQSVGKSVRTVKEILVGRRPVTAEFALALADALGTTAESWMNMESNYRLDLARRRRKAS